MKRWMIIIVTVILTITVTKTVQSIDYNSLVTMAPTSFVGRIILKNGTGLDGAISISNGVVFIETVVTNTTLTASQIEKLIMTDCQNTGGIRWTNTIPVLKSAEQK